MKSDEGHLAVPLEQAARVQEPTENAALLPCPFCGGEASFGWSFGAEWVECAECDVEVARDTFDEAAAAWNRRAAPAQAQDEREARDADFGDYVLVEQRRFGVPNEWFVHKVVTRIESNCWIDVPAQPHREPTLHDEIEPVLLVICCGVVEDKVIRYRAADCKLHPRPGAAAPAQAQDEREALANIPKGWRFCAADASIPGRCRVSLIRDEPGVKAWHALSEEEKETTSIYAVGVGSDFHSALAAAIGDAASNLSAKE